jgi:hypothetical protein
MSLGPVPGIDSASAREGNWGENDGGLATERTDRLVVTTEFVPVAEVDESRSIKQTIRALPVAGSGTGTGTSDAVTGKLDTSIEAEASRDTGEAGDSTCRLNVPIGLCCCSDDVWSHGYWGTSVDEGPS